MIPLVPGRLFDTRPFGPSRPTRTLSLGHEPVSARGSPTRRRVATCEHDRHRAVRGRVPDGVPRERHTAARVEPCTSSPFRAVPNLVMSKVGCSLSPTVNFYNSPFGYTHVLADTFGVITDSLKKQPPVCRSSPARSGHRKWSSSKRRPAAPRSSDDHRPAGVTGQRRASDQSVPDAAPWAMPLGRGTPLHCGPRGSG